MSHPSLTFWRLRTVALCAFLVLPFFGGSLTACSSPAVPPAAVSTTSEPSAPPHVAETAEARVETAEITEVPAAKTETAKTPVAKVEKTESDDWMALYLAGGKSGWFRNKTVKSEEAGKPVWITTNELSMSLARLGAPMTITQSDSIVEDAEGAVLRFAKQSDQGSGATKIEATVTDGKIHAVTNGVAGEMTFPAGALGPAAASRKLIEKGIKTGTSVALTAFTVEAPDKAVTITTTIGAQEKKDVLGRVLFLFSADVKNSLIDIPQTVWLDEHGDMFAMTMAVPGLGDMDFFRTEEAVAKADIEPTEVFVKTMIEPDRVIAGPRELKKARYLVSKKDGPLDEVYEGEGQSVAASKDGKVEIVVESWTPPADFKAATRPWTGPGVENYLKATVFLETGDELLKKLAAEAVGDEKDALACARRIEAFVRKKIAKKNFNVGFASAAETCKSLEGDCTEHGVMCAALARAVGLPSRVVVGIVYIGPDEMGKDMPKNGIFGFHMWNEILVADGRWFAIDAAIGSYDATHIAFVKSDLASTTPQLDIVLVILKVLGGIRIEVLEPK